ncbi:hypothetical protein [Nocardioides bizhenqiangii]|uniref:Uncharacterized protein n=1 Tax=Nocardioides bizhenqiangii TaxID=3095076 RepID=A0ABZ0ZWR3_9ACTN|nr:MULTISPECIES: hypothetical protein [unclassified Nocardioides]MDZ5623419.1 hypothetical protein [Nocardioides sp. HM23]WQQ27743.1 hypothetical protein SHK19_05780 [Nocardioides sp. HM61]
MVVGSWGEAYLTRLRGCAVRMGRELVEISARDRAVRLVEAEARTVEEGFGAGLLALESSSRVRTLDPLQGAAWLVAGEPPRARWESLPQLAAYVELLRAGYPEAAVRFETPATELGLDLAAVNDDGQVLLLGVARAEPLELAKLEALVPTFDGEDARSVRDVPGREAQRLAYQLWSTRAPYLWMVAAGDRRLFRVGYGRTITLTRGRVLPMPEELWPFGFDGPTPRVAFVGATAVAG